MIALLLALQVAAAPPPPAALGPIGRQALPATGCAAFLWTSTGEPVLVAMAIANPAHIRLSIDGAPPADLASTGGEGPAVLGFAPTNRYGAGDVAVTLALTVATRSDLSAGAVVQQGTLSVERHGRDVVVLPVAGLVGCAD